ncbi:IS3 family transposase, partial [Streptomyces caelestis]|uniref:IS3 family transposase n=1 Tax=Streptomyces caelestis TaxID=36816 RepID=UPI000B1F6290
RHLATGQARAGRQAEEKRTVSEIRAIHAARDGAHGAPRVHAGLRARGRRINRKRVTRLMRVNHIIGRHLRKKKR